MYQRTLRPQLSEEMKRIKSLSLQNLIFNAIFFANISGGVSNLSILHPISPVGLELKKNKSMSKTDVKLEKHQKSTRQF